MSLKLFALMVLQILSPFVALAEIEFYDRAHFCKKTKVALLSVLTAGYLLVATLLAMFS